MATPADILREIHRLRRYINDLDSKLSELPRRLTMLQNRVAYQDEQLKQAKDTISKLKVKANEDEVSLQATTEKIDKYNRQLNDIISKKEYDALQHEIEHARKHADQLEDTILNTYNDIEERVAQLPAQEAGVVKANEELANFTRDAETRKNDFSAELEKTKKQLVEVEGTLPPGDMQAQYDRLIRLRGDDAFSPITAKTCQACYTESTAQQFNELSQGKFVLCNNCGRIIYLAD